MRAPTTWINNDVKSPAPWTAPNKGQAAWANNDVKTPVQYATTGKQKNAWGVNYGPQQTYFYDDPTMTYDDSMHQYDYLVNPNTLNQRNRTVWAQS